MLLCPNTKRPTELWWSPEASQGLQVPGLMTSPHLSCATPLKYIKRLAPAAACTQWLPAPEKHPAQLPPPQKGFSIFAFAISKGGHSPIPEVLGNSLVVPK